MDKVGYKGHTIGDIVIKVAQNGQVTEKTITECKEQFILDVPFKRPTCALDIANYAIDQLPGEPRISGITLNDGFMAAMVYRCYHPVRRELLCKRHWKFATKEFELEEPSNSFDIPTDALRIQKFDIKDIRWKIGGNIWYRNIETSEPVKKLFYTKDEEDVELFTDDFIAAFVFLLAERIGRLSLPLSEQDILKRQAESLVANTEDAVDPEEYIELEK